jgi:uncharacterized protein YfdQ (DUF2303 family)
MTDERTEADAIADLAAAAADLDPVADMSTDPARVVRVRRGEQLALVNSEAWYGVPLRSRGRILVHDADSFVEAVRQRQLPYPVQDERLVASSSQTTATLYVDDTANRLVAVLNDDFLTGPGWRDYRVELELRLTPEWKHWTKTSGGMMTQEEFATFIEDGLDEIYRPPPATMLTLAQTFEATTTGKFKQRTRLGTGARTLAYEEDVQAQDQEIDGELVTLPEEIELGIRPFYGALVKRDDGTFIEGRYPVTTRIKFQIQSSGLRIGHKMIRPDDAIREAFQVFVEKVGDDLSITPIAGPPPPPVVAEPVIDFRSTAGPQTLNEERF